MIFLLLGYVSYVIIIYFCLYVYLYVEFTGWVCHAAVGPPPQLVPPDHLRQIMLPWMVPPDQVWLPWMVRFAASGPPLASRLKVDKTVAAWNS